MAVDLFICAGQSQGGDGNGLSASVPSHLVAADSGIQVWNGSAFATYQAGVTSNYWSQRVGILTDWGPEAQFLYRYRQKNLSTTVYLVKCCASGRALYNISGSGSCWDPAWHGSGAYFDNTTTAVTAAKAALSGQSPIVRAIIWMQGEADAANATAAGEYETLLPLAFAAMRSQWGDANTKIMVGRIAGSWTYKTTVQDAQETTCAGDALAGLINADSYTLHDGVHYDADSQVALGNTCWAGYDGATLLTAGW